MTLRLNGATSGYTEIDAPAVAGSNTILLPAGNGSANQFLKNGSTAGTLGWSSMVEDSSGRLLVNTTSTVAGNSSDALLQIVGNSSGSVWEGKIGLATDVATGSVTSSTTLGSLQCGTKSGGTTAIISGIADGSWSSTSFPTRLVFNTTASGATTPTERMRIRNDGIIATYSSGDVTYLNTTQGAGTTYNLIRGGYSASDSLTSTASFRVWSNGNVQNTNNSYTAISDIKLKENIVDANSQWNDIKALRVRNYNLKEGQTHRQIGLIAQEVEPVSPGLVYESPDRDGDENDLGTVTKSVNYSVLYMKAVKALQEAMERIEQLEAKVAALEAA